MAKIHCAKHNRYFHLCGDCKNANVPVTVSAPMFVEPVAETAKKEKLPYVSVRKTGYPPCRKDSGCKVCW